MHAAISVFLVAVLLASSVAKLFALLTNPFFDVQSGYAFPVIWCAVFIELELAYLNSFFRDARLTRLLNFIFFSACFSISSVRLLLGIENCGCMGEFSVPTYAAALFNLFVAMMDKRLVSYAIPRTEESSIQKPRITSLALDLRCLSDHPGRLWWMGMAATAVSISSTRNKACG